MGARLREETLQSQTDRRRIVHEKDNQRTDIGETMGEGGGDEEDGESEDDDEDGQGTGLPVKRSGTKRRNQHSFYFRTGTVCRTTSHNGLDVTAHYQVGGRVDFKKIINMPNGDTQVV